MRGAGCTWNDIVDRDLDGTVDRTRSRPIPSGQVTVPAAAVFLVVQALVGLAVLLQFNRFTIACGIASLLIVAIYPFMKRFTYWPQIVLGLAFSWGALMGWAAVFGRLDLPAFCSTPASIAWVIGYDTIYAHQDREDDALIGIKSTALLFGERTKPMLAVCYALAVALMALAGWRVGAGARVLARAPGLRGPLCWQIWRLDIDDPVNCLKVFKSNRDAGLHPVRGVRARRRAPADALIHGSRLEREDALPVVLHADHRPAVLLGLVVERRGEGADLAVGQPCAGP